MRALVLAFIVSILAAASAHAQFRIGIGGGARSTMPIAVLEFEAANSASAQHARDFTKVVRQNLQHSGTFTVVNPKDYSQTAAEFLEQPDWRGWRGFRPPRQRGSDSVAPLRRHCLCHRHLAKASSRRRAACCRRGPSIEAQAACGW